MNKQSCILSLLLVATFVVTSISKRANADDFQFTLGDIAEVNPVSPFSEQEQQYREFKRERLIEGYNDKVAADAAFVEACEALIKDETEGLDKLAVFTRLKEERKARCDEIDEWYKAAKATWKEEYKERRLREYRDYEYHLSAYILVKAPRPLAEINAKKASEEEAQDAIQNTNSVPARVEVAEESDADEETTGSDVYKLTRSRESGMVYVSGSVGDDAKMHVRGNRSKCSAFVVDEVNDENETGVSFVIEFPEAKKGKRRPHIALDPIAIFKYSDEYIEKHIADEIEKLD